MKKKIFALTLSVVMTGRHFHRKKRMKTLIMNMERGRHSILRNR